MKIVLDAGHGPDTPGKRSPDGSLREYEFNSAVADLAREKLLHYSNVEVMFTHEDGRDVPLSERTDKANDWGAYAFISIHANAFGSGEWNDVNGIETFTYTNASEESVELARLVHDELISTTGRNDRGLKTADFHVLRHTVMPAILVECGFMTNREEAELLKTNSYREQCATAIVTGLANMYNLEAEEDDPVSQNNEPSDWAQEAWDKAVAANIIDDTNPRETLTREQLFVVLDRLGLLDDN
ncbi:N-acetylmuramoyl-L-alanine amidase [Anaerobacillus alkaliphilus]|uniref:N-acetylmuramoyl-L-alanine amidase n=1 Tax=Anaerobacillus alkaliphilus TaxID=1548597 RepID=A0A4Q0VUR2_9BACI|nr:N-acetylmuramoyl-L-alanine amidase [Anaerobacillus alkaliphilus]RXJ01657.1 N-acetylmuramoyl-L-alanine amidase [Anaerobacillus alkaliphilus]